jgi:segregation and condensation protein B
MARPRRPDNPLDQELADLPQELRWREWMARVEVVIFASPQPVTRDVLRNLVGRDCSIDLVIEDIRAELRDRPYELVAVAGGWQFRTRAKFADSLRATLKDSSDAVQLTRSEMVVLASIAYHQPVTRNAVGEILGREVSRDVIGQLRALDLITYGPRSPQPGAPYTFVTTRTFLSQFGLNSLRDLPDMEALEDAGLLSGERGHDGSFESDPSDVADDEAGTDDDDRDEGERFGT